MKKTEKKLIDAADNFGRLSFQELITRQVKELESDYCDIVVDAVIANADNPAAYFVIDKKSRDKVKKLLKLLGQIKKNPDRFDVVYLSSCQRLSYRVQDVLTGEAGKIRGALSDALGRQVAQKIKERKDKIKEENRKKRVQESVKSSQSVIRTQAKYLRGKSLREKVLNPIGKSLTENIAKGTSTKLKKMGLTKNDGVRDLFHINAKWLNSRQINNSLKTVTNDLAKEISLLGTTNKNGVARITPERLAIKAQERLRPLFGRSQQFAKITARALASVAYHEQVQNLMTNALETDYEETVKRFEKGIPAYVFRAVMDARTSVICRTLNGKIIPMKNKSLVLRYTPPMHANCRSMLVPNFI